MDLGTEGGRYPHYVIFYINSNTKAEVAKGSGETYDVDLTRRQAGYGSGGGLGSAVQLRNHPGMNREQAQTQNQQPQQVTEEQQSSISQAIDMASSWVMSETKRLSHAIVLHAPHQIRTSYNAGYEEFTNGGIAGSAINSLLSGQGMQTSELVHGIMKEAIRAGVGGIGKAIGMEGAMSAIEKARGEVENPRSELLFKTVGHREFEFNYIFAPKSDTDSKLIKDIIYLFKYHMHPELSMTQNNGQYWVLPSEFDISYYYKNKENEYVNKITTCVLTSMNVDYTPNGVWQAFSGTDSPTHITMALRFKEIEPITRNMVAKGGF